MQYSADEPWGESDTASAVQTTGAPAASAYWGEPILVRGKLSFPSIRSVQPGFGKDPSFMVPSFTSIAVNSSCLPTWGVAEKPGALYFPGWWFFGPHVIWLSVSSQYKNCPAKSDQPSPVGYQLWSLFHLDHGCFVMILGLYRPQGQLS